VTVYTYPITPRSVRGTVRAVPNDLTSPSNLFAVRYTIGTCAGYVVIDRPAENCFGGRQRGGRYRRTRIRRCRGRPLPMRIGFSERFSGQTTILINTIIIDVSFELIVRLPRDRPDFNRRCCASNDDLSSSASYSVKKHTKIIVVSVRRRLFTSPKKPISPRDT